jgi:hypothetical protein
LIKTTSRIIRPTNKCSFFAFGKEHDENQAHRQFFVSLPKKISVSSRITRPQTPTEEEGRRRTQFT